MQNFLDYFIQNGDQFLALFSVAIIWFSLTSLGAWLLGRERLAEADIISGWAIVSIILTFGGVFSNFSISVLFAVCSFLALISFVFVAKREGLWIPIPFLKLFLLALPLVFLASAIQGSQWDEFSDWLVIPRYLYDTDHLPNAKNVYWSANFSAYPFNWHFINYLASNIAGKFLENIGPLFNILLLLAFSTAILNVIGRIKSDKILIHKQGWSIIALIGLATTLLNPTFAQKIVLTSYADTSTAVVTGFSVILAWYTLEDISEGNRRGTLNSSIQLAMAFVILINLKQATFALFGLIVLSFLLAAYRDRSISLSTAFKVISLASIPALCIYFTWRYHIFIELSGGEATFKPFSAWHLQHIHQILLQMLITLMKKGYYLLLVIIILALAIRAFWNCEKPPDRLFLLSGSLILGYNVFLLVIYISSFGEADAIRVASFWRYNMHLGPVVIAASVVWLFLFWQQFISRKFSLLKFYWVPIVLFILAPFVFAKKLRFDLDPMIQHYRTVGGELSKYILPNSGYVILDPKGTGESYNITTYEMNDFAKPMGYLAAFHRIDSHAIDTLFADRKLKFLMIFSLSPEIKKAFSAKLRDDESQLLKRNKNKWVIVARWPSPQK